MAIKTYKDGTPFTGVIGRTAEESSPAWPEPPRAPDGAPNVLFFVLDDVGYGQLSSFGGLVETEQRFNLAAQLLIAPAGFGKKRGALMLRARKRDAARAPDHLKTNLMRKSIA